ncbi:hypothetical protein CYMTET_16103 [Cymbomonas tetramitiformis]|uniref:Uncharacterized protein n=1 Tax=Cymbomonas tetramitiformis TaxID=36881 RepID=A0AAE0GCV4_9CHLO|nr:hypothetical protein CYMTET_16103 [Cymbomonas tetramitiformis]
MRGGSSLFCSTMRLRGVSLRFPRVLGSRSLLLVRFITLLTVLCTIGPQQVCALGKGAAGRKLLGLKLSPAALGAYQGRNISVLSRATRIQVKREPYTHVVLSPALPPALYAALEGTFPSMNDVLHAARVGKLLRGRPEPNTRHKIQAPQGLQRKPGAQKLHKLWQNFIAYHTSPEFYAEMIELFGRAEMTAHLGSGILPNTTGFRSIGVRGMEPKNPRAHNAPTILMDCQISINTPPVAARTTVRAAHIDAHEEIYAGLLYLRHAKDKSTGGNLQVIKCAKKGKCLRISKDAIDKFAAKGQRGQQYNPKDLKVMATVPYKANTFVMFINSDKAFHAVTPRSPTKLPRRFVNIVAQAHYLPPAKHAVGHEKLSPAPTKSGANRSEISWASVGNASLTELLHASLPG